MVLEGRALGQRLRFQHDLRGSRQDRVRNRSHQIRLRRSVRQRHRQMLDRHRSGSRLRAHVVDGDHPIGVRARRQVDEREAVGLHRGRGKHLAIPEQRQSFDPPIRISRLHDDPDFVGHRRHRPIDRRCDPHPRPRVDLDRDRIRNRPCTPIVDGHSPDLQRTRDRRRNHVLERLARNRSQRRARGRLEIHPDDPSVRVRSHGLEHHPLTFLQPRPARRRNHPHRWREVRRIDFNLDRQRFRNRSLRIDQPRPEEVRTPHESGRLERKRRRLGHRQSLRAIVPLHPHDLTVGIRRFQRQRRPRLPTHGVHLQPCSRDRRDDAANGRQVGRNPACRTGCWIPTGAREGPRHPEPRRARVHRCHHRLKPTHSPAQGLPILPVPSGNSRRRPRPGGREGSGGHHVRAQNSQDGNSTIDPRSHRAPTRAVPSGHVGHRNAPHLRESAAHEHVVAAHRQRPHEGKESRKPNPTTHRAPSAPIPLGQCGSLDPTRPGKLSAHPQPAPPPGQRVNRRFGHAVPDDSSAFQRAPTLPIPDRHVVEGYSVRFPKRTTRIQPAILRHRQGPHHGRTAPHQPAPQGTPSRSIPACHIPGRLAARQGELSTHIDHAIRPLRHRHHRPVHTLRPERPQ